MTMNLNARLNFRSVADKFADYKRQEDNKNGEKIPKFKKELELIKVDTNPNCYNKSHSINYVEGVGMVEETDYIWVEKVEEEEEVEASDDKGEEAIDGFIKDIRERQEHEDGLRVEYEIARAEAYKKARYNADCVKALLGQR